FKRIAVRIKKNYPRYKFIITGDALYATDPIISICKHKKWNYIFNFKPDRLKEINETFEDNINYHNETTIKNYYLSKNIKYKNHYLNVFKLVENIKSKKTNKIVSTTFRYISNLNVNDNNIKDIVSLGRKRWKIENEGFYTQKHRTFNITHLSSRNDNAMKAHYFFIQFAHTIRQLLEQGNILVKSLKLKIKEVSQFLIDALTSTNSNLNIIEKNFQLRFDS
ncbi:MAG: transposase, partial [Clostridium sp.]